MIRLIVITILSACFSGCAATDTRREITSNDGGPVDFAQHIKPIFEHRCVGCHNSKLSQAGLNLQDPAGVLNGTRSGAGGRFVVPGQLEQSLLFYAVTQPARHPLMMPGDGWGLNETQLQYVRDWIAQGAHWPSGRKGRLRAKPLRVEFEGDR